VANKLHSSTTTANRLDARLRSLVSPRLLRLWYSQSDSSKQKWLLAPLSFSSELYHCLLRRDQKKATCNQRRLPVYVISVGNLVAGGTGKTPFTLWLATHLQSLGHKVAILSRGYGRKGNAVLQAPAAGEISSQAIEYGDEPVLMARKLDRIPVWVGRKRWLAGMLAIEKNQPEIIILDDGFQHLSLYRDLDFVLLDARNPFGNGHLLPLGPLREPLAHLQRANAVILTRADDSRKTNQTLAAISKGFPGKPIFCCRHRLSGFGFGLTATSIPLKILQSRPSVAFSGIARPDSFFSSLQELGIPLTEKFAFPDHHQYQLEDLLHVLLSRSRHNAQFLITTQKDAVRLPSQFQELVLTAELQLDFGSNSEHLMRYIEKKLSG